VRTSTHNRTGHTPSCVLFTQWALFGACMNASTRLGEERNSREFFLVVPRRRTSWSFVARASPRNYLSAIFTDRDN